MLSRFHKDLKKLLGCSVELSTCFCLARKEDYSRNGYLSDICKDLGANRSSY